MFDSTAELGTELFVRASRFARGVAHAQGEQQSSIVWRVMSSLQAQGPLRASRLSELERVSQPSISTTLQRLERLGFVSREPDPTDQRATLFKLEELGEHELSRHRSNVAKYLVPYLENLNALDRAAIVRVCELMEEMVAPGLNSDGK